MQTVAIVMAILPVAVLLIFGVAALLIRTTWFATVCEVLAHGGVMLGGMFYLYFIVPRFKKIMEDFGVDLDVSTKILIGLSDTVVNYWYLLLPLWTSGVAVDALAFATFHRVPESRYVARVFSALVTVALLSGAVFVGIALNWGQSEILQRLQ